MMAHFEGSEAGSITEELSSLVFFSSSMFVPNLDTSTAIKEDRTCRLETDWWLSRTPPDHYIRGIDGSGRVLGAIQRADLQQPRLISLTRQACRFPQDLKTRREAEKLASRLFADLNDSEEWVRRLARDGDMVTVPTTEENIAQATATSYSFSSTMLCLLLMRYWTARVQILGIIQTLCGLPPLPPRDGMTSQPIFDIATARLQDVEATTNIAMSLQHIIQSASRSSYTLLPLITAYPVQVSFASWDRVEKRSQPDSATSPRVADTTDLGNRARQMKWWTVDYVRDTIRRSYGNSNCAALTRDECYERWSVMFEKHAGKPVHYTHCLPTAHKGEVTR
jgi:hypothetical protein